MNLFSNYYDKNLGTLRVATINDEPYFIGKDIANIPVIAVTANAFEYYKKQAEDYGMNGYVIKPLSKEKLYEEIARLI